MSAEPRRTRVKSGVLWRVLVASEDYAQHDEAWFGTAAEAFLFAAASAKNADEVQVDRCEMRRGATRLDLLNRASVVERATTVPEPTWRQPLHRAQRGGKS